MKWANEGILDTKYKEKRNEAKLFSRERTLVKLSWLKFSMNVGLYGKQIENPEEAEPGCSRSMNHGLCVKQTKNPYCTVCLA